MRSARPPVISATFDRSDGQLDIIDEVRQVLALAERRGDRSCRIVAS